jgi:glycine cleavage system H lipoate-binding protein
VGIDAFLSRALGEVERIGFVWQKGHHRPAAVVTAGGVDLEITLPFPLQITSCNLYLRANPERLTSEPYTRGWLFAGVPDAGAADGLLRGEQAQHWMEGEVRTIHEFLQQLPGPGRPDRSRWRNVLRRARAAYRTRTNVRALSGILLALARAGSETVTLRRSISFLAGMAMALGAGWLAFRASSTAAGRSR